MVDQKLNSVSWLENDLEDRYVYTLNSLKRGSESEPIKNSCNYPWRNVYIDTNSKVFICHCDAWIPIPVGDVMQFESIDAVIKSKAAQAIQSTVQNKLYTYCAVETCGIKQNNKHLNRMMLQISLDESCNLACPSCRRYKINLNKGYEFLKKKRELMHIMSWLENYNQEILITLSGSGDPLASLLTRPLFKTYEPKWNQSFDLKTNGLLLKSIMSDSPMFDYIETFSISIDAGSAAVYEDVRRPGRWKNLIENLDWLAQKGVQDRVNLLYCFQQKNWRDLANFQSLVEDYGFRGHIDAIQDWGTFLKQPIETPDIWTQQNGYYIDHQVLNYGHEERIPALEALAKVQTDTITLGPELINELKQK